MIVIGAEIEVIFKLFYLGRVINILLALWRDIRSNDFYLYPFKVLQIKMILLSVYI
jgi:hypothetical protein